MSISFQLPACIAAFTSALFFPIDCQASDILSLEVGGGSNASSLRASLQGQCKPHFFPGTRFPVCLAWEPSLSIWKLHRAPDDYPSTMFDIGFGPSLSIASPVDALFIDTGISVHWFSPRYRNADSDLSTNFQFGSQLGVSYRFSGQSRIGLRFQHYSNAGIKEPNDGVNAVMIRWDSAF